MRERNYMHKNAAANICFLFIIYDFKTK